jgi:cytochrome c peroxidase
MRGAYSIGIAAFAVACTQAPAPPVLPSTDAPTPFSADEAPGVADTLFAPLPASVALDAKKVALGKRLFTDTRLSGDGLVSCMTCHDLDKGGANGMAKSDLPGRPPVGVNIPTIFNAAYSFRFAWSGRLLDIGEQLDVAMTGKAALAGTWDTAAAALAKDPEIVRAFREAFPEGLTAASLREAMSVYSLSLSTPNSRFDRYLRHEIQLSSDELAGYELFRDYGCVSCHQGINVGGNMMQRFGVMRDYFAGRAGLTESDQGLYVATKREEDRHVFRVPSLRNVALTAPYFHDGSASDLAHAIVTMARYQLGREMPPEQVGLIAAFLGTLTGELDGRPL